MKHATSIQFLFNQKADLDTNMAVSEDFSPVEALLLARNPVFYAADFIDSEHSCQPP